MTDPTPDDARTAPDARTAADPRTAPDDRAAPDAPPAAPPRDDATAEVGIPAPGFRLPPGTVPGPVTLRVGELERSLAFYRDLLGFRVLGSDGDEVRLGAPGEVGEVGEPGVRPGAGSHGAAAPPSGGRDVAGTELVRLLERPGARPVAPRSRLGLFHFAVLLPSRGHLGALLRHLAERDVPLGASDHLVSEALYLSDPDGLGIEIYRDRPREAWRRNGRELAMTTEPLDAAAVVAAAGHPWDGLPPGTRMGHVHLHVGDLAAAEAFYHTGLGLDRVVWSYPGALFLSAGGYHHHLGLNSWARGAPPPSEDDAGLVEWTLHVPRRDGAALDDLAASLDALDALDGAIHTVDGRPESRGVDVEREGGGVRVRDPWGTRVRVTPASVPAPGD